MINDFTLLKETINSHTVRKQSAAAGRHSTSFIIYNDMYDVKKNNTSSFLIHTCSSSKSQAAVLPKLKTSIMKTFLSKYRAFAIALLIANLFLLSLSEVNAADRYSVASNNWNSILTWSATSGGASGASAPVAGDNVFIEGGRTVTISSNVA